VREATHAERSSGVAVVLVRNAVDHDSRVLREARTLKGLGLETTVLGVVSFTQGEETSEHDGFTVRRLGPPSRLGWRVYREISNLRPRRSASSRAAESRVPLAAGSGRSLLARAALRRVLRWASTLAYYLRAIPVVRSIRPHLVHANDYNTMWIGVAAKAFCGSAVVYDTHELWADRNLRSEPRWWLLACEAVFTRVADRVVTTSPAYAEELARRYRFPEPVVVRNIPERSEEVPLPRPDGPARGGDRLLVYVGGMQPNRGIEQSVRALPMVPGARLRLIGPGAPEYLAELERLVRSLELEERVEFADPVPPEHLIGAVAGADAGLALIQPACLSYRLTLPNKLFEYALAGLPVVGSDLPMISRFVREHGVGETVDPDDVPAIARAIRSVLEPERNDRYRRAAAESASALDWELERRILEGVYRALLPGRLDRGPAAPAAE
jgi:glycosyltransferase involved in cell wall biosynthesis